MLIDTHCHLNFKAFDTDLDDVIKRASAAGIEKIIIPGAKLDSSFRAVEIAQKYPNCYAAVGIHPHHALEINTSIIRSNVVKSTKKQLIELAIMNKVVAIGEIGLDYYTYKNHPPIDDTAKKLQKDLLLLQLEVAISNNLPIIIHCRNAQTDLFEIITSYLTQHELRGVFHCFDGDKAFLKQVLNLGFYIGFDGNSTYEDNDHLRTVIKSTPIDRLLLETDSPYLTPVPHRRTRNEPSYLTFIGQLVADLLELPIEKIAYQTSKNASLLFRISSLL